MDPERQGASSDGVDDAQRRRLWDSPLDDGAVFSLPFPSRADVQQGASRRAWGASFHSQHESDSLGVPCIPHIHSSLGGGLDHDHPCRILHPWDGGYCGRIEEEDTDNNEMGVLADGRKN